MSNSNNKSKKRYYQESIDTASRMSENITPPPSPSPSKKSTPSPSKKNNKNYENLLNKLERTGIKGTPSPVKKPTRSTSSGSIPKVRSSILKLESNTSEENISIAQTKSKSKSNSNSNLESGKNISFTSTKKTQVTGKNISFNSTKATQKSSKKKTVSRASTEASSKPKPKPKSVKSNSKPKKKSDPHGKLIRHLKNAIQQLKNKQNTQPMPKSVYLRDIKALQEEVEKLEEQKKMVNSIGLAPNTNTNSNSSSKSKSGSSSLRSYTSQEASFQKGRNRPKSLSPMSLNKSKSSPYSMMSINGSMVGSTKSKSSPPGTVRRSLLGEMSRVLNLSANRNSREAENVSSKKKSKKKSNKRSDK